MKRVCVAAVFVLAALAGFLPDFAQAQGPGIRSDGRDFYIGYMPGLPHANNFGGQREFDYVLVGSYQNNNTVTISYFDANGNEFQAASKTVQKGRVLQLPIDPLQMQPTRQGEVPEYKAARIHSRYPVTVQFYQEGSSTGGMYQAIPTPALGKNYVAASWFDNPLQNNPGYLNRDSSSSQFLIIATENNTSVTYTPNSTTYGGIVGVNSGEGSNGRAHPTTITLNRGQVYWVRSRSVDASNDISGSTIRSDKPIAVIAGQERALLGDPSGYWTTLDNDIRDIMVEEMTPVEDWGSDYPSIPFMQPAQVSRLLKNGDGDMYRIFTNDPVGGNMNMWIGNNPFSRGVTLYQSPAATFDNVLDPVDLLVSTTNPDGSPKKMYAVMYDYFQGAHDFDPGGDAKHKGGGGTTQSGGGESPQDEITMVCPNEMDLVPIDRYYLSTVFKVPQNSNYKGHTYINLITNKDSVSKIQVTFNGTTTRPLSAFPKQKQYTIPLHPELIGITYMLSPGDYLVTGNTPFCAYSYGRTESQYKDGWGYAAPCGEIYGSHNENQKPRFEITPKCDHWEIRVIDNRPNDEGIADIALLEDPDGFYTRPGRVSYNTSLDPQDPQFVPGDTSVSFNVQVSDVSKDGYAAVYVVDRAGNDTTLELHFKAQVFTLSSANADMSKITVGDQLCKSFTLHTEATGAASTTTITSASFMKGDPGFAYTVTPKLPVTVKAGDSVVFNVCYTATDTLAHFDTLLIQNGCGISKFAVNGSGITPIIIADDHDFGAVTVGDTLCALVNVKNVGNGDLIIDKNWLLKNSSKQFSFGDDPRLPITLKPGASVALNFCFHPVAPGKDGGVQDWGTNIRAPFEHQKKDSTILTGFGVKPGLNWDRPDQGYTVICDSSEVVRIHLINPDPGNGLGKTERVSDVSISGPDKAEFVIVDNQLGYTPLEGHSWDLSVGGDIWVDVRFTPDLSKGYGVRHAMLTAVGTSGSPQVPLTGTIRHAVLGVSPASFDFGVMLPGTKSQTTFVITNTGDTDLIVQDFNFNGANYTVISGPKPGDHIAPGATDSIVVEVTAPDNGSLTATGDLDGNTNCDTRVSIKATVFGASIAVAGTGHTYPTIYECRNDQSVVEAQNLGSKGAILQTVEIQNGTGNTDADQFTFDDGSRLKTLNLGIKGGEKMTFNVVYTPTRDGAVNAIVVYTWLDTSSGKNIVVTQPLVGNGYHAENIISLHKDYGNQVYTATTEDMVTIPVQLKKHFDNLAQVYGTQFTIRYLRDQFRFTPGGLQADPGLQLNGTPVPVADPVDNNYELLTVKLMSQNPITVMDTLAYVTWKYIIAKDSNTTFEIRDVMFLDKTGASVCWVKQDSIPGTFYGANRCGDFTIREFMRLGHNTSFSIEHIVPNPVSSAARVDYLVNVQNTPITMEIFNALGQKVLTIMKDQIHEKGGYQTQIDAAALSSGVYTIRVTSPNFEETKSMVVHK